MSDEFVETLESLAIDYEIVACDPALADTAQFCEAYGYALEGLGQHDCGHREVRSTRVCSVCRSGYDETRCQQSGQETDGGPGGVIRPW